MYKIHTHKLANIYKNNKKNQNKISHIYVYRENREELHIILNHKDNSTNNLTNERSKQTPVYCTLYKDNQPNIVNKHSKTSHMSKIPELARPKKTKKKFKCTGKYQNTHKKLHS